MSIIFHTKSFLSSKWFIPSPIGDGEHIDLDEFTIEFDNPSNPDSADTMKITHRIEGSGRLLDCTTSLSTSTARFNGISDGDMRLRNQNSKSGDQADMLKGVAIGKCSSVR